MQGNNFLMAMGERISVKRKEKRLTQEQLAEAVGVSLQTVSNIECGKKGSGPENIAKICVVLEATADYILLGEKNENQLKGISKQIASLSDEKYKAVESLVYLLHK